MEHKLISSPIRFPIVTAYLLQKRQAEKKKKKKTEVPSVKLKFPVSAHRRRRILPTCYFFSTQTLKVGETKLRCCSRSQKGLKGTRRKVAASLSLSLSLSSLQERKNAALNYLRSREENRLWKFGLHSIFRCCWLKRMSAAITPLETRGKRSLRLVSLSLSLPFRRLAK